MIGTLVFGALLNNVVSQSNDLVSYYTNLITIEKTRAVSYNLPKNAYSYFPNSSSVLVSGEYDYIIIGGGSAGAVIASRLSENLKLSILLLEAGGQGTNFSDIPAMNVYLQGSEFNWGYNTSPQINSCLGMMNNQCPYPRGKGLGGSSLINALMYVRGNKLDYDEWYSSGTIGWSYRDVLPLFKKSENFIPATNSRFHGVGGLLDVNYVGSNSFFLQSFIDANIELGRNLVDYNGKEQIGVSPTQFTVDNGKRDSTDRAFLGVGKNRTNLHISTYSLVTKINIRNRKAFGVTFSKDKQTYFVRARKEVILSAGSIGSPQILMLSGIGNRNYLQNLNIQPVIDLDVGENFQDQPCYWGLQFSTNYSNFEIPLEESVREYLQGYGPFTIGGNAHGIAFMKTDRRRRRRGNANRPDIEHFIVPSQRPSDITQKAFHYTDETLQAFLNAKTDNDFTIVVILLRPKSRGRVKLKSSSPFEYPLIEANYYTDTNNEDLESMYRGIQFALELTTTKAFKQINATLRHIHLPACQNYKYLSKKFWYCQLKQLTLQIYHPVGTCKMGTNPKNGAVVNHKLQVHKIKNLRVADASVIPVTISGHTNAVSIMIGEKLSDIIVGK